MAAAPTLASLAASVASLQATIAAQNVRLDALEKQIGWRAAKLTASWPVTGTLDTGVVSWARTPALSASSPVWFSIDGGARQLATGSSFAYGPLTPGLHRIDLFLAATGGSPELSHMWDVLKAT